MQEYNYWVPREGKQITLALHPTTFCPFPNKPMFLRVYSFKSFENTVGKREIARNEQFLIFPQRFFTPLENFPPPFPNSELSENAFSLKESKTCRLGKA